MVDFARSVSCPPPSSSPTPCSRHSDLRCRARQLKDGNRERRGHLDSTRATGNRQGIRQGHLPGALCTFMRPLRRFDIEKTSPARGCALLVPDSQTAAFSSAISWPNRTERADVLEHVGHRVVPGSHDPGFCESAGQRDLIGSLLLVAHSSPRRRAPGCDFKFSGENRDSTLLMSPPRTAYLHRWYGRNPLRACSRNEA